jgi:WD40 repeat protein
VKASRALFLQILLAACGMAASYLIAKILVERSARMELDDRGSVIEDQMLLLDPGKQFQAHDGAVNALAFSLDGRRLASAGDDATVRLWDLATSKAARVLRGPFMSSPLDQPEHAKRILAVAFSPDGNTLASGAERDSVKVWDFGTGQVRSSLALGERHSSHFDVSSLAYSADGRKLAAGVHRPGPVFLSDDKCEIATWDLSSDKQLMQMVVNIHGSYFVNPSVAFTPDGTMVGLSGFARASFFEVDTSDERARLVAMMRPAAFHLAMSSDGRRLVAVEIAGGPPGGHEMVLWEMPIGKKLCTIRDHGQYVIASLAFGPEGRLMAAGSGDGTVKLWNIVKGRQCAMTTTGGGRVNCVAISPDGKILAAAGDRGTIQLWNLTE